MKYYRVNNNIFTNLPVSTCKYISEDFICSIPFDPANTDYANFKKEINEGTAQLQDAEGNTMTEQQAKDFVKELP